MDNQEKARRMIEAAEKVADQYVEEGRANMAKLHREAFAALPVASLARLYDILRPEPPKRGLLDEVLGPTENISSVDPD